MKHKLINRPLLNRVDHEERQDNYKLEINALHLLLHNGEKKKDVCYKALKMSKAEFNKLLTNIVNICKVYEDENGYIGLLDYYTNWNDYCSNYRRKISHAQQYSKEWYQKKKLLKEKKANECI